MKEFLNNNEALEFLGFSRASLYKLRAAKKLVGYRVAGKNQILYKISDLEKLKKPVPATVQVAAQKVEAA